MCSYGATINDAFPREPDLAWYWEKNKAVLGGGSNTKISSNKVTFAGNFVEKGEEGD